MKRIRKASAGQTPTNDGLPEQQADTDSEISEVLALAPDVPLSAPWVTDSGVPEIVSPEARPANSTESPRDVKFLGELDSEVKFLGELDSEDSDSSSDESTSSCISDEELKGGQKQSLEFTTSKDVETTPTSKRPECGVESFENNTESDSVSGKSKEYGSESNLSQKESEATLDSRGETKDVLSDFVSFPQTESGPQAAQESRTEAEDSSVQADNVPQTESVHEDVQDGQEDARGGQQDVKGVQGDVQDGQEDMKVGQGEVQDGQGDVKHDQGVVQDGQGDVQGGQGDVHDGQKDVKDDQLGVKVDHGDVQVGQGDLQDGQGGVKGSEEDVKDGQDDVKDDQAGSEVCSANLPPSAADNESCPTETIPKNSETQLSTIRQDSSISEVRDGNEICSNPTGQGAFSQENEGKVDVDNESRENVVDTETKQTEVFTSETKLDNVADEKDQKSSYVEDTGSEKSKSCDISTLNSEKLDKMGHDDQKECRSTEKTAARCNLETAISEVSEPNDKTDASEVAEVPEIETDSASNTNTID